MKNDDIIYGLSEISLYLSNIGREDFAQTIEDTCKIIALLKERETVPVHEDKINKCECGDIAKDAMELLKEQEAKPVIVTTNAYGTRFFHCPKCNRDLYVYPRQLYCSNCGQAVKWE